MGCDVAKHRRRRLWEKDLASLAREEAGLGWANKGLCARQAWVEWDQSTFPANYEFCGHQRLLADVAPVFSQGLRWINQDVPLGNLIVITGLGFVFGRVDAQGNPWSVRARMRVQREESSSAGTIFIVWESFKLLLAPLPTHIFRFENFRLLGVFPHVFTSDFDCSVYPLDRCHDCSDDP